MVAPSYAKDDAAAGKDVHNGVVLGQPKGVPHRSYIKPAPKVDILGQVGQMKTEHEDIGDALIPLRLEMVLRHPESVIPASVHQLSDGYSLIEGSGQVFVGEGALID